jgi:biopolymer transport protein ExbD
VINFKSNMIDRRMQLPVVGTARPMPKEDRRTFMMVNLNDKGEFTVLGRPLRDEQIRDYIVRQAQTDRLTARRRDPNFPEGGELDTWVIIRADRATPFSKLYKVIKLCRDEGYRNFAFRALTPADAAKAQRGSA